jgi:hypothetical protein
VLSKSITTNKFYWHGKEIAESKYNEILDIIHNKPIAPNGYDYRLTESLEWEQYELPIEEETDIEATEQDYKDALTELGVDLNG